MTFTLQLESKGKITLPINPQDYTVSVSNRNTVTNVIQIGDINLIGKTGLREVTLSSFFPAKKYNFGNYLGDPLSTVNTIEGWRTSGDPCRVVIGRVLNMECTIESFSWGEQDHTGDIYFTIKLKEYKRIKTKKTTTQGTTTVQRDTKPAETNRTYTVKAGDCLWKIAQQFYGNGAEYPKIYEANKAVIDAHNGGKNMIWAGDVLVIP